MTKYFSSSLHTSQSKLEILDFGVVSVAYTDDIYHFFYQLPDILTSEEIIVLQGDTSAPEDAMLFQFEETPQFGSNDEESHGWTSGNEIQTESITASMGVYLDMFVILSLYFVYRW